MSACGTVVGTILHADHSGLAPIRKMIMKKSTVKIDWIGELVRVPSHERLEAFIHTMGFMSDADYWECLSSVWQTSEIVTPDLPIWKNLFSSSRACRGKLMTDEEQAHLRALPDRIKVFRGFNECHWNHGMSWTLSRQVAYFFGHYCTSQRRAILYGANGEAKPMFAEATVKKEFVFAYINERKEEEVILDPDCPLEGSALRAVPKNWKFRKPGA